MEEQRRATGESIDQVAIAAIVAKVIARLSETSETTADNGVISIKTIEQQTGNRLVVAKSAVITPAAYDEARRRGIRIERINETDVTPARNRSETISDSENPQRAETIRQQLARRGIVLKTINVILSNSPALEVHRQINGGLSAAMVTEISDVERFHNELSPAVWVLDMKRLNIPAAVNAAAKISQLAKKSNREGIER